VNVHEFAVDGAPALLVLPGGGFREHTPHDGLAYAHWLNSIGLGAVVLEYRLRPDPFPAAVQEARTALAALLSGELLPGADRDRIGVIGSSAGGLLAGLLATGAVLSFEPTPDVVPRPAFHVQSYGLADLRLLPPGAVAGLLGDDVHRAAAELSPVTHVDADTAPTFVWATAQDGPGLPNALEWARVLAENRVPVELHVYPQGRHGVGLADGVGWGGFGEEAIVHTARWTEAFRTWLSDEFGPW
jgi:acetyl esterase/lipase